MRKIVKVLLVTLTVIISNTVFSQQTTEEGFMIPVRGEIKVLLIWARDMQGEQFSSPSQIQGYGKGAVPSDAGDFFDPTFTPGIEPLAYLTKYFYEQSFGQYIVTGDCLDHVKRKDFFLKLPY